MPQSPRLEIDAALGNRKATPREKNWFSFRARFESLALGILGRQIGGKLIRPALLMWLLLFVTGVSLRAADGTNAVFCTNAYAIHHLSRDEAALGHPVRLTGVATYSDPEWTTLFIRDASGGMFIALNGGGYPTNGELVEVTGRTEAGGFLPVVAGASWRSLGAGVPPEVHPVDRPELFASQIDCEWSELTGVVRKVTLMEDQHHLQIDVMDGAWRVRVFVSAPRPGEESFLNQLVDAKVSVRGVAGVEEDAHGVSGLKVFVPRPSCIQVIDEPSADPFLLPYMPLVKLRVWSQMSSPIHRVHVRGAVTSLDYQDQIVLQEASGTVRLQLANTNQIRVGEVLEAVGFVERGGGSPVLEDVATRQTKEKLRVEPTAVAPAKILRGNYDSRLVQVTGILQNHALTATNHILTLLQDGILFGVSLQATNSPTIWERFERGDRVQATGVCAVQADLTGAPQSFQVLARAENDTVYLSRLHLFSVTQVLMLFAAPVGAWGLVLLWGMALKRRVREQTAIISARLEKETALEKRYHQLLENAAFPIVIFHRESLAILYVNQRAIAHLYGSATGATYSLASECCDNAEVLQTMLRELERVGQLTEFETRFKTCQGQRFWALVCANNIEFDQQPAVFLSFTDVSERKRTEEALRENEERLRQAHKMEGIGQLAGGIAHEFNNILGAMMLSLGMVETKSLDAETHKFLGEMEMLSNRAADLVRQLLVFSRKSALQTKALNLNDVVKNFSAMLRRLLGEHIALEFVDAQELPLILADQGMIEQVLMNLCLNARDAMPGGGRLTVAVQSVEVDGQRAAARPDGATGRFVVLSVSDTGCGMTEATRKRLFEPFFTTKDVGKGTGLGLATVYGIVKQHGGWIEVESAVGQSTTFRIYFPVCNS